MSTREARKEHVLEQLADYMLQVGMEGASLRLMAAAIGTSDRMLLYYFNNKEAVLSAVFTRIAMRMAAKLDTALPQGIPKPLHSLLPELWAVVSCSALKPYMQLWLELTARAARGAKVYTEIAREIATFFHQWICARVAVQKPAHAQHAGNGALHDTQAALLFATLEGLLLLEALNIRVGDKALSQGALTAWVELLSGQNQALPPALLASAK